MASVEEENSAELIETDSALPENTLKNQETSFKLPFPIAN